jgi:predicted enzyme related to lactoylglutathione lyase
MPNELLVNIDVPDLGAGISFYETGLGFTSRRLLFDGSVADLLFGGIRVHLIRQQSRSSAIPDTTIRRDYGDHWTPVHLYIVVDDLAAAIAQAVDAGARLAVDVRHFDWGEIAAMRDPFGHGFCLIAFQGGGYDGVASK